MITLIPKEPEAKNLKKKKSDQSAW
jgi:hypothetical protein